RSKLRTYRWRVVRLEELAGSHLVYFPWEWGLGMAMLMDELVAVGVSQEIVEIWKQEESERLLPIQEIAVREGGVLTGRSLLVVAPTSSGKTFIGEMAAVEKALQRAGTIFLVPFKAIA